MYKFLLHIIALVSIPLLLIGILITPQLNRNFDPTYYKHLGKHKSLILGSSRSHFGIDPSFFPKDYDLFNYAFTVSTSPYCETYYDAIKEKITGEKNAIFILEIDPLVFLNLHKKDNFSEENDPQLGQLKIKNGDPNYEYVFRNSSPFYKYFYSSDTSRYINHRNGYSEILQRSKLHRKEAQTDKNLRKGRAHPIAADRVEYFKKTVEFLQQYGTVFFVSVPVSESTRKFEKEIWPNFYSDIEVIAHRYNITYIDLNTDFPNMEMADGVHLGSGDSKIVSKALSDKIQLLLKQQH